MTPAPPKSVFRATRGFSSLGFAIIVLALSGIAAFAVPLLKRAQLESRAAATADELRTAAAAFQAYAHERGDWPPADAAPSEYPSGMSEPLRNSSWSQPTPIGGHYAWKTGTLHRGHRYAAAIAILSTAASAVSADRQQLEALDRHVDDGNFATGNFRLGFRNQPIFVLEH